MSKSAATILSIIFEPKVTFLILLNYIAFIKIENTFAALILIAVVTSFAAFLIYRDLKLTEVDDYNFANKEVQTLRYKTYFLIVFVSVLFLPFLYLQDKEISFEFTFFCSLSAVTLAIATLTYIFSFKISAHITFLGILISYFFTSEIKYILFLLLVIPLGWARIKLHKHTIEQVAVGVVIILVYFIVFDVLTINV